jgi:CRISPR system Cascade subunit CasD
MSTLLLRLAGPMQSWGTSSRFDQRDTGKEPSKSGVVGLVAAALGIDRNNWTDLEPLARLAMGVRHDRSGVPKREYQTAGCATTDTIIKADGSQAKDGGVVSERFYLADAIFLVALEGDDRALMERIFERLKDPAWPLALGRKSYVPSEPVWIEDGIRDASLRDSLTQWPWIAIQRRWENLPESLLASFESSDESGVLRMDQPLSSFAERRFGARFVRSEWIPFPQEVASVSK